MSEHLDAIAITSFVGQIPAGVNPYRAVADLLKASTQPHPIPQWAQWLQRCILVGFLLMWLQSCRLIYVRLTTKSFHGFSLNQIGLLRIDLLSITAISYFAYSLLTLVDLILEELILAGYHDQTWEVFLFGVKFLVIFDCSCALLWVCACQAASLLFETPEKCKRLPVVVRWGMNVCFICSIVVPIPIILVAFGKFDGEYVAIKNILTPMIDSLLTSALSYSRLEYRPMTLLLSLKPIESVTPHIRAMTEFIRLGTQTYFILDVVSFLVYIPLLNFTLRALYRDPRSTQHLESGSHSSAAKFEGVTIECETTRKKRNMLVQHALLTSLNLVVHLPTLIYLMSVLDQEFLRMPNFAWITRLGLNGPFVLTGNITLMMHNLNVELWASS